MLGRFVPIVRTFVPFVAGAGAMTYRTFAFYNVIGAVLWVGVCVGAGYAVRQRADRQGELLAGGCSASSSSRCCRRCSSSSGPPPPRSGRLRARLIAHLLAPDQSGGRDWNGSSTSRARHDRRARAARRRRDVPDDGLHPRGESGDSVGSRHAARGRASRPRRSPPALCSILMGARRELPAGARARHGPQRHRRVSGRPGHGRPGRRPWASSFSTALIILLRRARGLREAVMRAIPVDLRRAIAVAIGLFIAFIGLVTPGWWSCQPSTVAALARHPRLCCRRSRTGVLRAGADAGARRADRDGVPAGASAQAPALMLGRDRLAALALGIARPALAWRRRAAWPRFDTVLRPTSARRSTGGSCRCCSRS